MRAGGDVSKGFTMTEYAGPTPPCGTHRYIFMLYEQVRLTAAAQAVCSAPTSCTQLALV
jgi:phosphatidylethanolamine-binding protein (PEBP) family uncharacterized protein